MNTRNTVASCVLLSMILGLVSIPVFAEEKAEEIKVNERYRARAMAMGTSNPPVLPRGTTATVDFGVTRWTTPEQRGQLLKQLAEGGQAALRPALNAQDEAGWIRVTGPGAGGSLTQFPRETFRYAWQVAGEDGRRRLILALDRPISMWEARNRPRWRKHDVTLMVVDIDGEGDGAGQLAIGVQLSFNTETGTLSIETYGTEPVRLMNVDRVK